MTFVGQPMFPQRVHFYKIRLLEHVEHQITLVMTFVMIQITMLRATLMMETVVHLINTLTGIGKSNF